MSNKHFPLSPINTQIRLTWQYILVSILFNIFFLFTGGCWVDLLCSIFCG